MDYLLFCFEWWNKGGLVNYIILSSAFFVGLYSIFAGKYIEFLVVYTAVLWIIEHFERII